MSEDRELKKVAIDKNKLEVLRSLNEEIQRSYSSLGKLEDQYASEKSRLLSDLASKKEALSSVVRSLNDVKIDGNIVKIDIESGEVTYTEKSNAL